MSDEEIAQLREEIAAMDREIVSLVARRLYLAEQVGLEKRLSDQPVRVSEVEAQVVARIEAEGANRGIRPHFAKSLGHLLIEESVHRQETIALPNRSAGHALVVGGAGRMGRWLGRYLRSQGYRVAVHDIAGAPVDLPTASASSDVIAVATPIDAAASVLEAVGAVRPAGLVFDVTSLKTPVTQALRSLAAKGCTVASIHPLFGPHFGPMSQGTILLSDCGNPIGIEKARALLRATRAHLVDVPLEDHDEIMATLLGLSHLTLLSFARVVARTPVKVPVVPTEGSTFARLEAVTRGLLDDSPVLLREIQALNPHTPEVCRRLVDSIEDWSRAASDPSGAAFLTLFREARQAGGALR